MKNTATVALKPGMIVGEDVYTYKNDLLIKAKTPLDEILISKLTRNSIMCVEILEPVDLATTHFERVRLSDGFKKFEKNYSAYMFTYKNLMDDIIYNKGQVDISSLISIYAGITRCAKTGELLLDYLYNMLPSEDDLTYAHCLNSALIAGVFGTWIGLSREELVTLIFSGFFYDIGKFTFPKELIWKPSKLTDTEFEKMKTHTMTGFNIIKDLPLDENIIKATLQHHERCNGTGYPSKLREPQINRFAQYISIIDAYEAMTNARTYRKSLNPFQVIDNFEKTKDFYNSIALNQILQHIANSQLGLNVRLSNDDIGEVILINPDHLSRPLINVNGQVIDLKQRTDLEIEAIF